MAREKNLDSAAEMFRALMRKSNREKPRLESFFDENEEDNLDDVQEALVSMPNRETNIDKTNMDNNDKENDDIKNEDVGKAGFEKIDTKNETSALQKFSVGDFVKDLYDKKDKDCKSSSWDDDNVADINGEDVTKKDNAAKKAGMNFRAKKFGKVNYTEKAGETKADAEKEETIGDKDQQEEEEEKEEADEDDEEDVDYEEEEEDDEDEDSLINEVKEPKKSAVRWL